MIPVYQDVFGHPNGNCGSAVIASILELSLREVPQFKGGDGLWFVNMKSSRNLTRGRSCQRTPTPTCRAWETGGCGIPASGGAGRKAGSCTTRTRWGAG